MCPNSLFTILLLCASLLGCSGAGLKNSGGPPDSINTSQYTHYYAVSHVAARTFAILPQITREEQEEIFRSALSAIEGSPAWVQAVLRRQLPSGVIIFTPEGMAHYEDNVIRSLTTPAAKQAAKKLRRPWPIWQPPIIWGAPSPPLPPGIGNTG